MNIYKNTRLTPYQRKEIWRLYTQEKIRVTSLSQMFSVSRPIIYNMIKKARLRELNPRNSTHSRFKSIKYGIKRLAKVEEL